MKDEQLDKWLEEMVSHFCNFYEMEKQKPDEAWRNGPKKIWGGIVTGIFSQQPGVTLKELRENHLLVYRMKDRSITDMIRRLRSGKEKNTGETMIEIEGNGKETILQSRFPAIELEMLERELMRRKVMEKLFWERERMLREGKLIFGVQGEIVRAWKTLYEEIAVATRGNVVTKEDIRKDSSLIKKMKSRAIIDMTFRMRKKAKKTLRVAEIFGTLKEDARWEDVVEEGYWMLVDELEERRKSHRLAKEATKRKELEEEAGEDTQGRLREDFGDDEDETSLMGGY